eukprot:m.1180078 g.1180078  ORF g.1180078 m.1180078 type:complete len:56 (+) comp24531_c0_seq1:84-251(+)
MHMQETGVQLDILSLKCCRCHAHSMHDSTNSIRLIDSASCWKQSQIILLQKGEVD